MEGYNFQWATLSPHAGLSGLLQVEASWRLKWTEYGNVSICRPENKMIQRVSVTSASLFYFPVQIHHYSLPSLHSNDSTNLSLRNVSLQLSPWPDRLFPDAQTEQPLRESMNAHSVQYNTFWRLAFHECDQVWSGMKHIAFCLCLLNSTLTLSPISAFWTAWRHRSIWWGRRYPMSPQQTQSSLKELKQANRTVALSSWVCVQVWMWMWKCESVSDGDVIDGKLDKHECTMSASV
jgi:hypothetical protein